MFTKAFWKDTSERAISSVAESAVSLLSIAGLGLVSADWASVVSVAGLAGVLTVLKALAASQVNDPASASFLEAHSGRHEALTKKTVRR